MPTTVSARQAAFLSLDHREALFGGAAGGAKTWALLMGALQYVDVPGYSAVLFRRTSPELTRAGGLIPIAKEVLAGRADVVWNEQRKQLLFPSGALLAFEHMQLLKDVDRHERGPQYQYIGFDELTTFAEPMYRRMFSRLRRPASGPLSRVPVRIRSGSNPGGEGHEWVKRRFVVEGRAHGRPYIRSLVQNNPFIDVADYVATLEDLDPVTRERMLRGDWTVYEAGAVFDASRVEMVTAAPEAGIRVRAWDCAGSIGKDAAYTVGLRMLAAEDGYWYVEDVVRFRARPGERDEKILATAAHVDGPEVHVVIEQEPADSGEKQADDQVRMLAGFNVSAVRARGDKVVRAGPVASQLNSGHVRLVEGGDWVSAFLDELRVFGPKSKYKDQVDALSLAFGYLRDLPSVWTGGRASKPEERRPGPSPRIARRSVWGR